MANGSRVEIKGVNALARSLKEAPDELQASFKGAHLEAAETVRGTALGLVPVRSGALKATIRASATLRSGRVRAGTKKVPYAGVIHFGWGRRGIHPQEFLTDALDRRHDDVLDAYMARVETMADVVITEVNHG